MGLFRLLFSKYKCHVYTAFGNDDYFRVVDKLKGHGVSYQTDVKRDLRAHHARGNFGHVDTSQYDFYVREEDEEKAMQAIHRT
ncbi:hypothetical protein [Dethiobacter alkaliphilus]|uniref:DUF2007 domain-containing protein n=1 Tax=Dethiobacter alkaliphilus AHT 1 TaxID=555088 RepID=C0GIP7_DETAL|nr:hypothetical protein [Dethiobacter alkaliphilus]EEG76711.1 hypothetical protein DealDRAFT_2356 [Dethiobacter alkaliphilus AHT 1]